MDRQRKEELLDIAAQWAHDQIDNWIGEYEAWDHLIGDELTEDEWHYIRTHVDFTITAGEKDEWI